MARGETFKLQITGLRELRAKLHGDDLYALEFHAGLEEIAALAAAAGAAAAASGKTGDLAGGISYKLSGNATTMSARIVSKAKHRGYNYGRLLEFAPKYGHQRWLLQAIQAIAPKITEIMNTAAHKITAAWEV